ncbi:MAG: succinylglutamate desuccinylase/aspartoacylase family protein [Bacteroidota bacterium]
MPQRIIGKYIGPLPGPLIFVFGSLHGNEPAGVLAMKEVFRLLNLEPQQNPSFSFRGCLIGVRGNIQAIKANKRFLEKDLNRQFTLSNINKVRSTEEKYLIAEDRELRAIVDLVDQEIETYQPSQVIVLDLHTTTADGGIFSIATNYEQSINIARGMHAPVVTGLLAGIKGTTLHYFCQDNFACPIVSVTFEAGQHNDPQSAQRATAAIINLLRSVRSVRPQDVENKHDQLLINYSDGLPALVKLLHVQSILPGDGFEMMPGYQNFQRVRKGEVLAKTNDGPITASQDCLILMPLYQQQGEDGFFLVESLKD